MPTYFQRPENALKRANGTDSVNVFECCRFCAFCAVGNRYVVRLCNMPLRWLLLQTF